MDDVKQLYDAGIMCTIDGDTSFVKKISGSKTQVHLALSPMMILAYMISLTMMSEVLSQGRYKHVFSDLQTLIGKQDCTFPLQQHSGQHFKWQYHP